MAITYLMKILFPTFCLFTVHFAEKKLNEMIYFIICGALLKLKQFYINYFVIIKTIKYPI